MNDMNTQEELLEMGAKIGMCDKFVKLLSAKELTVAELCELFHRGQDFCIEHNFPSIDFMRQHVTDIELANNGIIVRDCDITEPPIHVVVLGDTQCTIDVPDDSICDITLREDSETEITIGSGSVVYVSVHNNAQCKVLSKGAKSRLSASQYGGTIFNERYFDKITKK